MGRNYAPGAIQLYTSGDSGYKDFLAKVEKWRIELGFRRGFLYLLTYSPHVCCGIVSDSSQLCSVDAKIHKALSRPGPPLMGSGLHVMNFILQRAIMFNN